MFTDLRTNRSSPNVLEHPEDALSRKHGLLTSLAPYFVPKQPPGSGGSLGNQGSRSVATSRVGLTGTSRCPIIRFPSTTMKDSNTPATKADMQEVLKRIDERIDKLDNGLNRKLDDFRSETNRKLDEFRNETNEKLDDIDRQLRVLVEQSHHDLGDAGHDAEEVLKDHGRHLENRVARLEEVVGITAA